MCYWVDYSGDFLAVAKEKLAEIGFIRADVYVKYHLWCVLGGQKAG